MDKERPTTELPVDIAGWIELYKKSTAEIKALEEKAATAKEKIQEALGDNEVGLIDGRPVVRWTKVSALRLDAAKAKDILDPKVYEYLCSPSHSRRFSLVNDDEAN
jgi:predicted phage-related endonuclease